MTYEPQELNFPKNSLEGISEKTIENHYEKLYKGYVKKYNEILERLDQATTDEANASWSQWRGLKDGETFTLDAIILHELYFENLGAQPIDGLEIKEAIEEQYESMDEFEAQLMATGMSARGWVVVAISPLDGGIDIYQCDAHNQGGIWAAWPILILDVYEHAYFIDYGADRKNYLQAFWKNINWNAVNDRFTGEVLLDEDSEL